VTGADHEVRHQLIENRGASAITHSARVEKGNKKNSSQERLCLLTCLLMGDRGLRAMNKVKVIRHQAETKDFDRMPYLGIFQQRKKCFVILTFVEYRGTTITDG
jgi:hypothetical protein